MRHHVPSRESLALERYLCKPEHKRCRNYGRCTVQKHVRRSSHNSRAVGYIDCPSVRRAHRLPNPCNQDQGTPTILADRDRTYEFGMAATPAPLDHDEQDCREPSEL